MQRLPRKLAISRNVEDDEPTFQGKYDSHTSYKAAPRAGHLTAKRRISSDAPLVFYLL